MEFLDIQTEFAMAQRCSMAIVGESNYAQKILAHMCCGFPLSQRGVMPHRCVCPPQVVLHQRGFECEDGNSFACRKLPGTIALKARDDPSKLVDFNLSFAFLESADVSLKSATLETRYSRNVDPTTRSTIEKEFISHVFNQSCSGFGERVPKFCMHGVDGE